MLTEESLSKKFIKKGFWLYAFTFLMVPFSYIMRIIITGDLPKEEVGIVYGVIGLLALLSSYNDFGLTESLNFFLPKYLTKKKYGHVKYLLMLSFAIQMLTSILIGGLLYCFAGALAEWHFKHEIAKQVIQIMTLFFVGLNLLQVGSITFSATQNTKFLKGVEFFRTFIATIAVIGVFFVHPGNILAYTWAWIIGLYAGVLLSLFLFFRYYYNPYLSSVALNSDITMRKSFIRYSLATFLGVNIGTLLHQLDQQILINMTSSIEGGVYATYLSLVNIPFLIFAPLTGFLFPVVSELFFKEKIKDIRLLHSYFSHGLGIIMLWMSALFLVAGPAIAIIVYGASYRDAGQALQFIAPFLILNILVSINFQIMSGVGMIRERIWILFWALLLNTASIIGMIWGFQHSYLPFPSATSATVFAVGSAWALMFILSRNAIKQYYSRTDFTVILKNIFWIAISMAIIIFFDIPHLFTSYNFSPRIQEMLHLLVMLSIGCSIFIWQNFSYLRSLWGAIKKHK